MAAPKLKYAAGNSGSTTLSNGITNSDTTAPLTATTNFDDAPTPGEGMVLFDEGEATEEISYSTGLSGSSLTIPTANRGLEGTSAAGHATSSSVRSPLTAGMWNDLITSLLNILSQSTGAVDTTKVVTPSGTQTLTNKTLTTPIISSISNTGTLTLPTSTDTLVGKATTDTLTNKRITKRVSSTTSTASPTPNADTDDVFALSAQAATGAFVAPSGTPTDGQGLIIRVVDNGTARSLSFASGTGGYTAGGVALPSTTTTGKYLHLGFIYNTSNSLNKWMLVASANQT